MNHHVMRIRPGVKKFFNFIHYCRKKQLKIHKGWVLFRLGLLKQGEQFE